MMNTPTDQDWEALRRLAERVNLPPERVSLLRRHADAPPANEPGRPFVLLLSEPGEGLELLLSHWLSGEVAAALDAAGERPLVLGPDSSAVTSRFPTWAGLRTKLPASGHLIALRLRRNPAASLLSEFAAMGGVDVLLVVTRLSQPLNQHQREIARAFAPLASVARVLVVGLPGEMSESDQLAVLEGHVVSQLRQSGFQGGRCLGAGVWFTDGDANRPGTLTDPARLLQVNESELAGGREAMLRQSLADLLEEIRSRCADAAPPRNRPMTEDDRARLTQELTTYLSGLGRKAARRAAASSAPMDNDALRAWVLEELRGWGAYLEAEGAWMRFVDRLRPGAHAGLLAEAEHALAAVSAPRRIESSAPAVDGGGSMVVDAIVVEAQRAGVALVCSLAAYWLAGMLPIESAAFASFIRIAAFICAAGIAYGVSRRLMRPRVSHPSKPASPEPAPVAAAAEPLEGWNQFERRLVAWFAALASISELSCAEECNALIDRLGINHSTP